ncbi:hypothetical protein [Leptospira interrogans]|uniref:hypothetical protein n=1 Tax=Leptospira interrogans TaxID=173 RepID=UPI00193C7B6F|nr:hypothetical protein [Leptospira interrogans]MBM2890289.1 hypothetical protein [Leptospira interrogans]
MFSKYKIIIYKILKSQKNPFNSFQITSNILLIILSIFSSSIFLKSIDYSRDVKLSLLSLNPCYWSYQEYKTCFLNIIKPVAYSNNLLEQTSFSLNNVSLDKKLLNVLNHNSVDIYPWELSEVEKYNLTWKSRPTFQSYISYTPWIDLQNNRFWNSKEKPKFILWDTKLGIKSIDDRYLFNDEPISIITILTNYKPVVQEFQHILLELRNEPILIKHSPTHFFINGPTIFNGKFNENIEVPIPDSNCITRVKIKFDYTLKGYLKNFLFKADAQGIVFNFHNTPEKKFFRLIPRNSISGICINPLVTEINLYTLDIENILKTNYNVKSFMIITEDKKMLKGFQYQWEYLCAKDIKGK